MTLALDTQPRVLVRAQAQRRRALQLRTQHERRRLHQSRVALVELDVGLRQIAGPLVALEVVAAFGDEFAAEFGNAVFGVARRGEVERDPVLADEAFEAAAREVERESGRIEGRGAESDSRTTLVARVDVSLGVEARNLHAGVIEMPHARGTGNDGTEGRSACRAARDECSGHAWQDDGQRTQVDVPVQVDGVGADATVEVDEGGAVRNAYVPQVEHAVAVRDLTAPGQRPAEHRAGQRHESCRPRRCRAEACACDVAPRADAAVDARPQFADGQRLRVDVEIPRLVTRPGQCAATVDPPAQRVTLEAIEHDAGLADDAGRLEAGRRNGGAFHLGACREPVRQRTFERVHTLRALHDGFAVECDGPLQRRPVAVQGEQRQRAFRRVCSGQFDRAARSHGEPHARQPQLQVGERNRAFLPSPRALHAQLLVRQCRRGQCPVDPE